MSHLAVRNAFIAEFNTLTAIAPFIDTVNVEADPPAGLWFTAEWYVDFDDQLCYEGVKRRESGTIDIQVFDEPGNGQDSALTAAEQILEHFKVWRSGDIETTYLVGPREVGSGDSEGRYYGAVVSISYNYYY